MAKKKDDSDGDFNTDVFNFFRRIEDGASVHDQDDTRGSDNQKQTSDEIAKDDGGKKRRE